MATVLENYRQDMQQLQQQMEQERITSDMLWRYGELVYRIGVLETCRAYSKSAPVTTKEQFLTAHYQMFDAYIQNISLERNYGPMRGQDTEKERNAARANLSRVVGDFRKRFSSFIPSNDATYSEEISKVIKVFMPVWLQMRETFVPLKKEKKEDKH